MESKQLSVEIATSLSQYKNGVEEKIKKIIDEVALDAKKELENNSPKKSGKYSKGWRKKSTFEDLNTMRATLYNAKKPSLTNLLENGHLNRDKKTHAKNYPHIKKVEEHAIKEVESKVLKELAND